MPDIITCSTADQSRQALQQKANKQQLKRLFRGAYVDAQEYEALDSTGKYRIRAKAFLATHPKLQPWGITAAALQGAPILNGAPLHFAGTQSNAKSKQDGCAFHEALPSSTEGHDPVAQMLFESAISSPLPDALLAADYLLSHTVVNSGQLIASKDIDEKTTEAIVWQPIDLTCRHARLHSAYEITSLHADDLDFLGAYSTARETEFTSPEAELAWFRFAQLCMTHSSKRGVRKAIHAGLYFSDQTESAAESLLVARCVELGFEIPRLQVTILDPGSGKHLGRVDGLWPSDTVLKGLYQSDSKFGRYLQCRQLGDNDSVVIEFDGQLKYQQDYVNVLEKERQRQNAIGNLGFRFVRVNWSDLMHPDNLRSIFEAAHVPTRKRK